MGFEEAWNNFKGDIKLNSTPKIEEDSSIDLDGHKNIDDHQKDIENTDQKE